MEYLEGEKIYGVYNCFFLFAVMPASVAGYYLIKLLGNRNEKWSDWLSNLFLVLVSLCFYGWARLEGIALLSIYVLGVWMAGKGICYLEKKAKYKRKVCFMTLSILAVTGILIWYKYYNFIAENLSHFFGISLAMSQWIVPLGISFITFTAISYLVDVFRGDAEAGSLLDVFLYLSFFPKVISGPIVQWKDFQRQTVHRRVDETEFLDGLNRIMIGFAKKVILADSFGAVISKIDPYIGVGMDVPTAWLFAFFYMMQIYYDFSGYSDIAIGLAQLFGFHFKENFQFPYRSKSITEFWRRWHISLGTWFRSYIYIPLGGNRKGMKRTLWNLFCVFLLTGIWHGAAWNYILWGVINGVCVLAERCIREKRFYQKIPAIGKWVVTMAIVFFSWQVFYFSDFIRLGVFVKSLFGLSAANAASAVEYTYQHYLTIKLIFLSVVAVLGATTFCMPWAEKVKTFFARTKTGLFIKETGLILLMIVSVIFMINSSYSPFLYFQY